MKAGPRISIACSCGRTTLETAGAPILSLVCYCESCRTAARRFDQAPGAPPVLNGDGGVDYCLFRKDRVWITGGAEHLQTHRLDEKSPTCRVVAGCCHAPMFLDFTVGHWLSLYRDRLPDDSPLPEIGVMARDLPASGTRRDGLRTYPGFPPRFMFKLAIAWVAMGFGRPAVEW